MSENDNCEQSRIAAGEGRREEEGLGINPAMKRHYELEIERRCKMLQEM